MNDVIHDMSPLVDMTRRRETGPTRSSRPIYVDLLPPCNNACPAGEDIQGWLGLAQGGKIREAWQRLMRDNPFPAVHGRVCYHPCESACNRGELDSAVSIHAVERFLGDKAAPKGWTIPVEAKPSGKRVLVVGAGPSGLSAAYPSGAARSQVEIHEAGRCRRHAAFRHSRLPPAARRADAGDRPHRGDGRAHRAEPQGRGCLAEQAAGEFDAVFVAIGAQIGKHIDIPARDAAHVVTAVSLLHDVGAGETPKLGRRVVIYGAGDTAMDAARTAKRLGAEEALIVFFRTARTWRRTRSRRTRRCPRASRSSG